MSRYFPVCANCTYPIYIISGSLYIALIVYLAWCRNADTKPVFSTLSLIEGANVSVPGIGFALHITHIDIASGSFAIDWWPVGCNQLNELPCPQWVADAPDASASLTSMGCDRTPDSYELWIDLQPYWTWNATANLVRPNSPKKHGRSMLTTVDTFKTSHPFSITSSLGKAPQKSQFSPSAWYPFDGYMGATVLEAFDSATNASLPIYFVHPYGGVTGFAVSVDVEPVSTPRTSAAIMLTFSIARGTAVSLFALALAATNWFLTAGMVWIAFAAGMGRKLPQSVLLLPLANILALPQLRAAMPDVPDFGIFLDIISYEINLLMVVLAAVFIMAKMMFQRPGGPCQSSPTAKPSPGEVRTLSRSPVLTMTPPLPC
ncbi:hypothetical protein C8Q74DRAFT_876494 [Fomes fomentarius]|nr:hypothetical protein C8Q74DRAFT_876494 [Fomes fomentarius]